MKTKRQYQQVPSADLDGLLTPALYAAIAKLQNDGVDVQTAVLLVEYEAGGKAYSTVVATGGVEPRALMTRLHALLAARSDLDA